MDTANTASTPDRAMTLTKAVMRATDLLGLRDVDLAQIIGVSPANVSRYRHGNAVIDPDRKPGELALLLVRVFRSLDPLVGSDAEQRKAWMHSQNTQLRGVPASLVLRTEGLVQILAYVEGMHNPHASTRMQPH